MRKQWQQVDGVLLLDKAVGLSSNAALQQVRRLFNAKSAGHTGTLDPLASGLLPVCMGEATKFSSGLLAADKTYVATLQLGRKTTTGDAEGETLAEYPLPDFSLDEITSVVAQFHGEQQQLPPMYSALKLSGRPLYELARQGIVVERTPRHIRIDSIRVLSWQAPSLQLEVRCSKGTYIRVLAEDIGDKLACGAFLSALRRTSIACLSIADALTLEQLQAASEQQLSEFLRPVDFLLKQLPRVDLDAIDHHRFCHGQPALAPQYQVVSIPAVQSSASQSQYQVAEAPSLLRVYHQQQFLGLGEWRGTPVALWPKRLKV